MSRTQKILLSILTIVICGLFAFLGTQAYGYSQRIWDQPLGPALSMPTSDWMLPATWTASPPGFMASPTSEGLPQATNTPVPSVRCDGPAAMTLLAVGTDSRSNSYIYGLADVIRVIRVDFVHVRVAILEFPRDLWVEIPDIADNIHGQDHEKLNQAYLYGNPGFGYYDGPGEGSGLLARTLALNFGVAPEHYVAINMRTFEKIIDAVGGIDVYLPNGLDGRTSKDRSARLVFPAGDVHLDGEEALTLARIRNEGVFERASSQNLVMCALQDKLTRPSVVVRIPALIESFRDAIKTDLTPEQISQLACIGTQLEGKDVIFASFPRKLFKSARIYDPVFKAEVFIWDVDYDVLRDYVRRFNIGAWPAPAPSGEPSSDKDAATCE